MNISQKDVEKLYRLIKQHTNGIALDDPAQQYPPKDPTVPYGVAQLLADGRVRSESRGEMLYCIAVDTDDKVTRR